MIFVKKTRIKRFKKGEHKAFRELYDEHYESLYFFGLSYISDTNIVEDILQDAFIKIWDLRDRFDDELSFKAFLYKAIRNASLNVLKHQKVKDAYFADEEYSKEGQLFYNDNLVKQELSQMIKNTIDLLPDSAKEIYLLGLEGLKNKDIAEDLGISINTVKTQKQRASKFVKERILKIVSVVCLLFFTPF